MAYTWYPMNVSRHCSSVLGMPFLRSPPDRSPLPEAFPDVFHGTDEDRGASPADDDGKAEDIEEGEALDGASVQTLRVAFTERNEQERPQERQERQDIYIVY
jgi:hypothetical protein